MGSDALVHRQPDIPRIAARLLGRRASRLPGTRATTMPRSGTRQRSGHAGASDESRWIEWNIRQSDFEDQCPVCGMVLWSRT
jgi:hypothetical protein